MSVFAGDDEIRSRIDKISEVMINIENVTPARIEEAKTKATKVMALYLGMGKRHPYLLP